MIYRVQLIHLLLRYFLQIINFFAFTDIKLSTGLLWELILFKVDMNLISFLVIIRLLSIEEAHDEVLFFHLQGLLLLFVIYFFL